MNTKDSFLVTVEFKKSELFLINSNNAFVLSTQAVTGCVWYVTPLTTLFDQLERVAVAGHNKLIGITFIIHPV